MKEYFNIYNRFYKMVIISKAILVEFGIQHADSIEALNKWYEATKKI